jgi:hypothetical protein
LLIGFSGVVRQVSIALPLGSPYGHAFLVDVVFCRPLVGLRLAFVHSINLLYE